MRGTQYDQFTGSPEPERRDNSEERTPSPIQRAIRKAMDSSIGISDRAELIERIKRGESPTWVPNRTLEDYYQNNRDPPRQRSPEVSRDAQNSPPNLTASATPLRNSTNLRRSPDGVARSQSALHSGDFTQQAQRSTHTSPENAYRRTRPSLQTSWVPLSPTDRIGLHEPVRIPTKQEISDVNSRRTSVSSFSSSFVLRAPTSPLIQSSTADLQYSPSTDPINIMETPFSSRRHTMPPQSPTPLSFNQSIDASLENSFSMSSEHRTETWQPRSVCSGHFRSSFSARRTSFSEQSPLQKAAMVGSYEESILRGRMSTVPSKPLGFVAQIGVLGLGNCKPSLKCPKHVSVPFPAVFYSYTGGNMTSDDGPSPYVGLIDLENTLKNPEAGKKTLRNEEDDLFIDHEPTVADSRKTSMKQTSKETLRCPPGGCYRIPQKGQLQIVIKNPNKTAVKLFLVPYDLRDMKPGTKTFIRQKAYSAGPVPVPALSSIKVEPPKSSAVDTDRQALRYLIHLNICCPSKNRYYLYKSIRVVFANRVPDGKENLRNEVSLPEPRYTTYKPQRDYHTTMISHAASALTIDKANRRRSAGYALGAPAGPFASARMMRSESDFAASSSVPHYPGLGLSIPGVGLPLQQTDASRPSKSFRRMSLMKINPVSALPELLPHVSLSTSPESGYMDVDMDDVMSTSHEPATPALTPPPGFLQTDQRNQLPLYALAPRPTAASKAQDPPLSQNLSSSHSSSLRTVIAGTPPPVFGTVSPLVTNKILSRPIEPSPFRRSESPALDSANSSNQSQGLLTKSLRELASSSESGGQ